MPLTGLLLDRLGKGSRRSMKVTCALDEVANKKWGTPALSASTDRGYSLASGVTPLRAQVGVDPGMPLRLPQRNVAGSVGRS